MSFSKALPFTIESLEGGYVYSDRPGDQPTYAGLTEKLVRSAGYQWNPPLDRIDVAGIYRSVFWDPSRCDQLPEPADAVLFQCVVNVGQEQGVKILQRAVGAVADGSFGPKTLKAALAVGRRDLPDLMLAAQDRYYHGLNNPQWIKGWLNRTEKVRKAIANGVI
jgi:lysozyme family protein